MGLVGAAVESKLLGESWGTADIVWSSIRICLDMQT